jgi:hypothetical protein
MNVLAAVCTFETALCTYPLSIVYVRARLTRLIISFGETLLMNFDIWRNEPISLLDAVRIMYLDVI